MSAPQIVGLRGWRQVVGHEAAAEDADYGTGVLLEDAAVAVSIP